MSERRYWRKDVSDAELDAMPQQRYLQELAAKVVPRRAPERPTNDRNEAKTERRADEKRRASESTPIDLVPEEREYLESIYENPNRSITARARDLALSSYKSNELKTSLLKKELILQFALNLGLASGGIIKLLELTNPRGYEALGIKPPRPWRFECSPEHRWWQKNIRPFYKSKGFHAEIEFNLNGKRADIVLIKGSRKVAVEVGLTPKNEVVNVLKDLEAGFSEVVVACKNTRVREAVQRGLEQSLPKDAWQKVKLMLLNEFSFVKELVRNMT